MADLTPLEPDAMREAGLEAIRKAERARNKAQRRARQLKEDARRHLQLKAYSELPWWQRVRTRVEDVEVDERLVDVVADAWQSSDPKWKGAVNDNRWYLDQAMAYGANKE